MPMNSPSWGNRRWNGGGGAGNPGAAPWDRNGIGNLNTGQPGDPMHPGAGQTGAYQGNYTNAGYGIAPRPGQMGSSSYAPSNAPFRGGYGSGQGKRPQRAGFGGGGSGGMGGLPQGGGNGMDRLDYLLWA